MIDARTRPPIDAVEHARRSALKVLNDLQSSLSRRELRVLLAAPRRFTLERNWAGCPDQEARLALRKILIQVCRHDIRMLRPFEYVQGCYRLAAQWRHWVRPVEEWEPTAKEPRELFFQLACHLLARYPVPPFMAWALLRPADERVAQWFRHLGQGGSIRTAPGMPLRLTKRMGHEFCGAPDHYQVVPALRWGQVIGLGGSRELAENVAYTGFGTWLREPEEEAWWHHVLQWLVNQPDLDPHFVFRILPFLMDVYQENPSFSMKGRSTTALLHLMHDARLEKLRRAAEQNVSFEPSGIGSFLRTVGDAVWRVEEILDLESLVEEAAVMHHCVDEYSEAIASGCSSIWSVTVERNGKRTRVLTVEVVAQGRQVDECQGPCNRQPTDDELAILALWAEQEGLSFDVTAF